MGTVGTTSYSYLGQLQTADSQLAASKTTASSGSGSSAPSTTSATQSLVSSLLGGSNASSGLSSEILSLLQSNDSGNSGAFNAIATLLNGPTTNDAGASLDTNLYDTVETAAIQAAKDNNPSQTKAATGSGSGSSSANSNPIEALINEQTQASVAYNQTLQQNVQNLLNSESSGSGLTA